MCPPVGGTAQRWVSLLGPCRLHPGQEMGLSNTAEKNSTSCMFLPNFCNGCDGGSRCPDIKITQTFSFTLTVLPGSGCPDRTPLMGPCFPTVLGAGKAAVSRPLRLAYRRPSCPWAPLWPPLVCASLCLALFSEHQSCWIGAPARDPI